MNRSLKWGLVAMWMVITIHFSFCQRFEASADVSKTLQNSAFTVRFSLSGAKGTNFSPPNFSPFEVVSGPSQQTSMSIVNGAMSQSMSFEYTLFAPKLGRHTIPSASIKVNGKLYRTKALTIEVIKGTAASSISEGDKETYVKMEASSLDAILGQQITLEYKLYTQQDVNGYDLLNEPEYEGFFSQELGNYRASVSREIIDGKEFYTKVIKKVALFPQRTGQFDFEPVIVTLAIPIPGAKKRGGFFSSVPTRKKRVSTNALKLLVKDPPQPAPISFSGAVGKYDMSPSINTKKITTDDAFVIKMEVRGTGDGKTFSAPNQPEMENMEYYDPNVIRDEDTSRGGVVSNYKQIEYLIVPKKPGRYIIRPEFTYFDIDSNDYVTLMPQEFRVNVAKGTRSVTRDDRDVSITQTLLPDRGSNKSYSTFSLSFFDSFWWTSFALGILGFIGMGYQKYRLIQIDNLDPEEKRRRKAMQLATSQLEVAKSFLDQGENRKFYEEISLTMNRYLGNKFGMKNTDFQKEKIASTLKENSVDQVHIDQYLTILKSCEMAIFAGQSSSKMDAIFENSKNLILQLEE
ncbi:MAG: BatD family protein [Bacteroidota bacterium]